jgi:hypothetical protein
VKRQPSADLYGIQVVVFGVMALLNVVGIFDTTWAPGRIATAVVALGAGAVAVRSFLRWRRLNQGGAGDIPEAGDRSL